MEDDDFNALAPDGSDVPFPMEPGSVFEQEEAAPVSHAPIQPVEPAEVVPAQGKPDGVLGILTEGLSGRDRDAVISAWAKLETPEQSFHASLAIVLASAARAHYRAIAQGVETMAKAPDRIKTASETVIEAGRKTDRNSEAVAKTAETLREGAQVLAESQERTEREARMNLKIVFTVGLLALINVAAAIWIPMQLSRTGKNIAETLAATNFGKLAHELEQHRESMDITRQIQVVSWYSLNLRNRQADIDRGNDELRIAHAKNGGFTHEQQTRADQLNAQQIQLNEDYKAQAKNEERISQRIKAYEERN